MNLKIKEHLNLAYNTMKMKCHLFLLIMTSTTMEITAKTASFQTSITDVLRQ